MKAAALSLACIALGVTSCSDKTAPSGTGAPTANASELRVVSELPDYRFVRLHDLPSSPEKGRLDEACSGYRAEKLSDVARAVEQLGWIVTSEAPLGRFKVVTFTSGFDPGTSALCFSHNANIAVYDNGTLVALAYAKRPYRGPDSDANPIPLGVVEAIEDKSGLLILTDPPGAPVGELRGDDEYLRLTARAKQHTYCQGRASVPDIYAKGIRAVRKKLLAQGWVPARPAEAPGEGDRARDMAQNGLLEAQTCSGTGVGYCAWTYRSTAGLLHVITVGSDFEPAVVGYNVECTPQ